MVTDRKTAIDPRATEDAIDGRHASSTFNYEANHKCICTGAAASVMPVDERTTKFYHVIEHVICKPYKKVEGVPFETREEEMASPTDET